MFNISKLLHFSVSIETPLIYNKHRGPLQCHYFQAHSHMTLYYYYKPCYVKYSEEKFSDKYPKECSS